MDACIIFSFGILATTFFILGFLSEKKREKDEGKNKIFERLNYII